MIKNELTPTGLKTSDFFFELPEALIAQHPTERRDDARLMVLDRKTGGISHRIFRDITDYLRPGDVLVVNDSKVIPARIYGKKIREDGTEGARYKNVFCTYSHGPVLPKNPTLCDGILAAALTRKYGSAELAPLGDMSEREAHESVLNSLTAGI